MSLGRLISTLRRPKALDGPQAGRHWRAAFAERPSEGRKLRNFGDSYPPGFEQGMESRRSDLTWPGTRFRPRRLDRPTVQTSSEEAPWDLHDRSSTGDSFFRSLVGRGPVRASPAMDSASPNRARPLRSYRSYLGAVSAAGLSALALLIAFADWGTVAGSPWEYGLFGFFVLLGELMPIGIARQGNDDAVTISTAFAFAALLAFGAGPAVALYAGASIVFDLVHRSPASRLTFNAGQYALSVAAAAGMLRLIHDLPYPAESIPARLPAIFAAAAVSFLVNTALAGTAPALLSGANVLGYLRRDLAFQVLTSGLLLAISPVIVIAADASLALVPLLFLPTLAIYMAGRQSLISEYHASHDVLTGLPNRSLLHDRLEHDLALARREGTAVGVMILDLDDFKDVNDTLGHLHGDLVLQAIGPRFGEVLRETDTLARLGGDEFAVVLPSISGLDDALTVAAKITAALERPFPIAGLWLDVRTSIGIACFPDDGEDVGVLLRHADVALYKAKHSKTACEAYSPEEDEHTRERLGLAAQLRRGIATDELELHYQPKFTLPGGELKEVEALVRWRHPQLGLLAPNAFIPLAEQTGLIRPLAERVMDEALRQARSWRDAGLEVRVSVNLSTRNLVDRGLPGTVQQLLDKWSLPASALQLEITESALLDEGRRARTALDELSSLGIRLAIDDFGTGYSSLTYLRRLPVSEIKIDKSFVSSMLASREDAVIVRSTIELARNLGLETTAEGVEQESTCRQLTAWGCHFAQGFLLGRPVGAAEVFREADRARLMWESAGPLNEALRVADTPRLAAVPSEEGEDQARTEASRGSSGRKAEER
jgi:diguanylate cyclase (GGDEF)-like protein